MFHQVSLLSSDSLLLRFLWRNLRRNNSVDVYEWQVLPFGATCSPCCATYALQKCVQGLPVEFKDVQSSVMQSFYVDNCLQSFPTTEEAKDMLMKLHSSLAEGGFEIRQWASNHISVIDHLPKEARSVNTDL